MEMTIESEVRSYCRSFPARFVKAQGNRMWDEEGREYIDLLSGCGALNYGHNHPELAEALIAYIQDHGIAHAMDLDTQAKWRFLEAFEQFILLPRKMDYKVQFTGPTGTNTIEAAIKLARKVTGRSNIIAFTNAFHGCTLGSLALTGNQHHRKDSAPLLGNVTRMPFDGYFGPDVDTSSYLETMLGDPSSGVDAPAAIIFETVQGEGGLNVASPSWAHSIERIARAAGALLITDEIQTGCGRTGPFFSFERLGIAPDIVCMAKAISGFGLPMALNLIRPDLDVWKPAEHNGTFRGNNHAFVTAKRSLEVFWNEEMTGTWTQASKDFEKRVLKLSTQAGFEFKGAGFMSGINFVSEERCTNLRKHCFEEGLIVEASGARDEVLKLLPSINVSESDMNSAFKILEKARSRPIEN
jgi:diaminobutyrate-2-oxoglutarate transaminase